MAEVYRARQLTAFNREVAIKVIRTDFSEDATFRARFLREAQAISRLSHPNILPLIEFGDAHGTLYLVMPWIREGTLRDLLRMRNGPLSLEETRLLFLPLCDAVQYAHEEGIIHRDIKPQNVLLQRRVHVLLTDFGIAHDRAQTQVTVTGAGIGSAEYMAPEQALGQATTRSDIYSLGIVLYQMLTGMVPFTGSTPIQVLLKHAREPLPDPSRVNPNLPGAAVQILQTALAKDPGARFESAQAIGQALQQIGSPAAPPTRFPRPIAPPISDLPTRPVTNAPSAAHIPPMEPATGTPETTRRQGTAGTPDRPPPASPPGVPTPPVTDATQPLGTQEPAQPHSGWIVGQSSRSDWSSAPTWSSQSIRRGSRAGDWRQPPTHGPSLRTRRDQPVSQPPQPRGRGPLIAALAAALVLIVAISSIAYGYFGLGLLRPDGASKGAQPVPATPAATQPASTPTPSATTAPTSTNTQQPTATPTSTPPPAPSPTPTRQPTNTPAPTSTPTTPPTSTPTPSPTATPTPSPTSTATPTTTPTSPVTPTPSAPTATGTPSSEPTAAPSP